LTVFLPITLELLHFLNSDQHHRGAFGYTRSFLIYV